MTETEELLHDLKAVYAELHPTRDPEAMRVDDATLALGVLLRRELRERLPSSDVQERFTLRGRILHNMAQFDPKDPE